MARTDSFLDDLIGVHDITVNGGSKLPRRSNLNFIGSKVEDVAGITQVTLAIEPTWLSTVTLASNQNDYSTAVAGESFAAATEISIKLTGNQNITGFLIAGTFVVEKRIWNDDAVDSLTLKHDDSGSIAANRIFCPGDTDLVIAPKQAASIVYNPVALHWNSRTCLV